MLKKITFISSLIFVIALCLFKMPSSYSKLDKSADSKNSIELKSYSNNYCKSENCNFDYTGTEQMFIAPKSGKYKIEAWGASGYSGLSNVVDHGMGGICDW